jgi:TonB-linked SusC/RagA family outer membrane protein
MKTKFNGILTLLLALVVQITFAQSKTISGTVSDDSGPLPGVSIIIKGTNNGSETDFDGNYVMTASVGDVLQYSFVGMEDTQKTVGASNTMNVTMESGNILDEVVVVAYGTQTKEAIVGSVAVVSSDVIEKQQVVSITNAIQGSVPGVNIISAGGQPGDNPTIRIRGIGSINAGADPLIILDGSPFNGNINSISSDQVESMNVLKDAAATALYGSRAANGVILIVTKKGRKNAPTKVTFRSSVGFADRAVDQHDRFGTDDLMTYQWEAIRNSNQYEGGQDPITAGTNASNNLVLGLGYNPYGPSVPNPVDANGNLVTSNKLWETDWEELMFNDNAQRTEYGLTASGGTENSTYFLSANYLDQEGSVIESDFERITTRLNVNTDVNNWLDLGFSSAYSTQKQNRPTQSGSGYQSAVQWTQIASSIYPVNRRDENGEYILDGFGNTIFDYGDNPQVVNGVRPVFEGENAYGSLFNYDNLNRRHQFNANGFINIKFADYLSFKSTIGYEQYTFDGFQYIHNEFGYAANAGGRVSQDRDITRTTNFTNALNFNKTFGANHNVSANLIQEAYKLNYSTMNAQGIGFLPNVQVLNGSTTPESVGGAIFEQRIESYLARVAYNYDNKYFVEGSWRTDSSSQFSPETREGEFFSVGGSWIISKENFMQNASFINYLKLRGSYGELGNNNVGYFPYTNNFDTGWNELGNTGVLVVDLNDPRLTWETTAQSNVGLDFRVLENRLKGTVEYYNKESVDLVYDQPLPPSTGFEDITTNIGSLNNSGVEVSLEGSIIQKDDFTWNAGFNVSFDRNEITELTQDEFINGTKLWKEGNSLYQFYVREYAGVDPSNGDALWYKDILDVDGEPTGVKEVTNDYATATRYETGKESIPDFMGGFNTNVRFKNFDLSLLFNFSFGAYIYDSTYASLMNGFENLGRAASPDLATRWQNPGDITYIPRLSNASNDFNATSDRFLFQNDYIRLKALNIGYNFDKDLIAKAGLSGVRIYFQGDNLFTYQSHEGIDPEQSFAGTTNSRSFNQRIMSLGFNIEL